MMSTRRDELLFVPNPNSFIHSVGTGGTGLTPKQLIYYMNNLGIIPITATSKPISPPVQFVKPKKKA